jgi:hypothetical protein
MSRFLLVAICFHEYCREVPWRFSDVLIAFTPIILNRLGPALPNSVPHSARFALYRFGAQWRVFGYAGGSG